MDEYKREKEKALSDEKEERKMNCTEKLKS